MEFIEIEFIRRLALTAYGGGEYRNYFDFLTFDAEKHCNLWNGSDEGVLFSSIIQMEDGHCVFSRRGH